MAYTVDSILNDDEINPEDVRFSAMNFLARREHSLYELKQKLRRRFPNDSIIDTQLQRLTQENLQSDQRFAESFVRQRAGRGLGLSRVRQEMRERGLGEAEIALAVEVAEIDWRSLAVEVYQKKYGCHPAQDMKDKAKRMRFMQYRGFPREYYESLLWG